MNKIFAIHPVQETLVKKLCFKKCGKIIVGGLSDPEIGALFPCREEKCQYEEKRLEYGTSATGDKVYIRKLREEKGRNDATL